MQRRNFLMILLTMLTVTAILTPITVGEGVSQIAKLSVTPLRTTGVAIGGTFKINVTVAEVTKLFSYQYALYYNTTVLTATKFKNLANMTYDRFNYQDASEINDDPWTNGTGYVSVSYNCAPMPEMVGLTSTAPVPLTEITFRVDANGTSTLDIIDNSIAFGNIYGDGIKPPWNMRVSDGLFSNVGTIPIHDIKVTGVTVSTTTAEPGDSIGVDVALKNNGDYNETFSVTAKYNVSATTFKNFGSKTVTSLAPGASTTLSFNWNTAGLQKGKYLVAAEATVEGEDNPNDNYAQSQLITLGKEGGGIDMNIVYIGVAVAVVIIAVIGVYLLRRRK